MKNMNIGFIGLGEMGKPMAKNLLDKHFTVTTCGHVTKGPVEELRSFGAKVVSSPKEVAAASEVIISMVRDVPQTDDVVLGKGFWEGRGVWQGIKPGSIVILGSTLAPIYCQKLANEGKERGIDLLDSPVSGGYQRAAAGTLTFMVGGDKKVFDQCRPIFEAMGENIYYIGGPGMGQALKLVNNYMTIVTSYGTSEAIAMGLKAGLDLKLMLEVVRVSSGNSSVVERWDIMVAHKKEYEKHESGVDSVFHKDMTLAVNFAEAMRVKADLGRLVLKMDDSRLFPSEPPD